MTTRPTTGELHGAAVRAGYAAAPAAELLARYIDARDEAAFRELVERFAGVVGRACRAVLGRDDLARDAFQETFLNLVRHGHALRNRAGLAAWLDRVARAVALNLRRREARQRRHAMASAADPRPDPPPAADEVAKLRAALALLPAHYRLPLELVYLDGLTHAEAAQRLARPKGTIDSAVSRGLKRLRAALGSKAGVVIGTTLPASARAVPAEWVEATVRAAATVAPRPPGLAGSAAAWWSARAPTTWAAGIVTCAVVGLTAIAQLVGPFPIPRPWTAPMPPVRILSGPEVLEPRDVPAVTAVLAGGVLTVTGTDGADQITFSQAAGRVGVGGVMETFPAAGVSRVDVLARGGDDRIDTRALIIPTVLDGGPGGDLFQVPHLSRTAIAGLATEDRLSVAAGSEGVVKAAVDANGVVWAMLTNVDVWAGGSRGWQNKADFAFDPQSRVVFLERGAAALTRSVQPFGNGDFVPLADNVAKWQFAANGTVWALQTDGRLKVEGVTGWENKADFAFDGQNRVFLLDTPAVGRGLARSRQPYGNGALDILGTQVVKWLTAANGSVWVLQANGNIQVDGATGWVNKADFAFDTQNRVLLLDNPAAGGGLARSRQPFGNGDVDVMGERVVKWQVTSNGWAWALQADGRLRVNGQSASWENKADFAFDGQSRLLLLDTVAAGAGLARSVAAFGDGGTTVLATGVAKWRLAADATVWALRANGDLLVEGTRVINATTDFAFDAGNRVILLGEDGKLSRSVEPLRVDDRVDLLDAVTRFQVRPGDSSVFALQEGGKLYQDAEVAYSNVQHFELTGDGRRLYVLHPNGLFQRLDGGAPTTLATNTVRFQLHPTSEAVYELRAGNAVYINGALNWGNVREFALPPSGREIYLVGTQTLLERYTYADQRIVALGSGVTHATVERDGGVSVVRTGVEPAQPYPGPTGRAGYVFTGRATFVINPELHLAGEWGTISVAVRWQLTVPNPTSPGNARAAGLAAFNTYLQQAAAWRFATVTPGSATGDVEFVPPTVSVTGRRVVEETTGRVVAVADVRLSDPSPLPVTVRVTTGGGTATAVADYTPATGVVEVESGETQQTVGVFVVDDADFEGDETFLIDIDSPTNATLGTRTATVTIESRDNPPAAAFVTVYPVASGVNENYYIRNSGPRTTFAVVKKTVFDPRRGISESFLYPAVAPGEVVHLGMSKWGGSELNIQFDLVSASYTSDPRRAGALAPDPLRPVVTGGSPDASIAFTDANDGVTRPAAAGVPGVPTRVASADITGDGVADVVSATGAGTALRVEVLSGADGTTVVAPFDPFGGDFTGGGYVAAGDLDGDGWAEFVVTPDQGGGPRVTVFSFNADGSTTVRQNFLGIDDANFRGGARAAVGDVNGDGTPDLVVAAGFGGGPRVAVFEGKSVLAGAPVRLVSDFFAFPGPDATNLRNGAFVAAGDIDGDGFAELVFGGGPGGAPRVFVLSGALVSSGHVDAAQANPVANFFVAGDPNDRGGARVAVTNSDGDGRADVAVGSGAGRPAKVRVYLGKDFAGGGEPPALELDPFGGAVLADGVYVG